MAGADLWPMVLTVVFAGTMAVAMVWDMATYELPDTLSAVLVVAALAALATGGQGWGALLNHGLGALGAFAFGVLMFALGQWGGGDVKFLAATALWLGWPLLVAYVLAVAVAGGVLAILVLIFRRFPLPAAWAAWPWLERLHRPDQGLPYGLALGCGGLVVVRSAVASVLGGP